MMFLILNRIRVEFIHQEEGVEVEVELESTVRVHHVVEEAGTIRLER
jgi:ribosome biogenesis SPOUT family RNA methylase Rps3